MLDRYSFLVVYIKDAIEISNAINAMMSLIPIIFSTLRNMINDGWNALS